MRLLELIFVNVLLAVSVKSHGQAASDNNIGQIGVPQASSVRLMDSFLDSAKSTAASSTPLRILPVWSHTEGRWRATLALVASGPFTPALAPQVGTPVDWQLMGITPLVSSGVRWQGNSQTYVDIRLDQSISLEKFGSSQEVSPCWVNSQASSSAYSVCSPLTDKPYPGFLPSTFSIFSPKIQTGWSNSVLDINLTAGASWLSGVVNKPVFIPAAKTLPGAIFLSGVDNQSRSIFLDAQAGWQINPLTRFTLEAVAGQWQLSSATTGMIDDFNQAGFKVGLNYGAFSGNVSGRTFVPLDSPFDKRWSGVDLEIAWRTPWQGELIFGTQNIWSNGASLPYSSLPTEENVALPGRIPYVQYHQDL